MEQTNPIWVIVPAAGCGSRMQAQRPKQYLTLGDRCLLEHTLDRLFAQERISHITVVVAADDAIWPTLAYASDPRVSTVMGGETRAHSVFNGIQSLAAAADDWVCVHDAARPMVTAAMMERLWAALWGNDIGAIVGMPMVDTVKQVSLQGRIQSTLPREQIWRAQTPQVFRYSLLQQGLSQALDTGVMITDEAHAVEQLGHQPIMVHGDSHNFKVTLPEDVALMQQLLMETPA